MFISVPSMLASITMFISALIVYKYGPKYSQRENENYGIYQLKRLGLLGLGALIWVLTFKMCVLFCPPKQNPPVPPLTFPSTIKSISPPPSPISVPKYEDYTPYSQRSSVAQSSKASSLLSEM